MSKIGLYPAITEVFFTALRGQRRSVRPSRAISNYPQLSRHRRPSVDTGNFRREGADTKLCDDYDDDRVRFFVWDGSPLASPPLPFPAGANQSPSRDSNLG